MVYTEDDIFGGDCIFGESLPQRGLAPRERGSVWKVAFWIVHIMQMTGHGTITLRIRDGNVVDVVAEVVENKIPDL